MHLRGLDLNLLVALDALLTEQNVTRAAEKMYISQPGMSGALRKLREHFDDPLLESIGRRLELTPRARELAGPVREILRQARQLVDMAPLFDPGSARRVFKLAASSLCSELMALPLAQRLLAEAPGIRFEFEDMTGNTVSELQRGVMDCIITLPQAVRLSGDRLDSEFGERELFTDRMVLAMAAGNQTVREPLSYEEFCQLQFVETSFGSLTRSLPEQILQRQIEHPSIRFWLPNFQLSLQAVAHTDLVTIAPSLLVARHAEELHLRTAQVPVELPLLSERLYWHARSDDDRGHMWFRDLLAEVAAQMTGQAPDVTAGAPR